MHGELLSSYPNWRFESQDYPVRVSIKAAVPSNTGAPVLKRWGNVKVGDGVSRTDQYKWK